MEVKGTLKYRKVQRTPQTGENAGKEKVTAASVEGVHLIVRNTKSWSNAELRKKCKIQEYGGYIGTDEEGTTGGGDTTQGGSGTTGGGTQEGGGGGSQDSGDGLE